MGYKHNKEDILNVGYNVLRKNGYHGVGINQILKESGIPKGSFYNFFESKEDFAQQVVRQYGCSNESWIANYFEQSVSSPVESLKAFYRVVIKMNEDDDYAGGCLVNNMSIEVGGTNDVIAAEADEHFVSWLRVLAGVIEKGQKNGEIIKKFEPMELAEYLHAGFYGALSRSKVTRSKTYLESWLTMTFNFIRE